jgi:hypothetical protein
MTQYRALDELAEEYFRTHPEEINSFLEEIFESYSIFNFQSYFFILR